MNLKNGILFTSICLINIVACSSSNTVNESWMADNKKVLANKKLTDIVIPGSHYSNAYDIDNSKNNLIVCSGETHNPLSDAAQIEKLIESNSQQISNTDFINYLNTQTNSVRSQLNNGVRYLEFKVCIQSANYYTSNYYLTDTLDNTINQISEFINSNNGEIILIDLDNNIYTDYGTLTNNDINIFHNYLQTKFGSYLMPKKDWQKLTLGDIWATKHRIILISSNPILTKYYDVWDKNEILNLSPTPEYNTIKKLTLVQQTLDNESSTPQNGKFNLLPIYSEFNPERDSPNQLKTPVNDHLIIDYLRSLPLNTPLNIIVTDKKYNRLLVDYSLQKNLGIAKLANESQ
jgi:hypothetical protein